MEHGRKHKFHLQDVKCVCTKKGGAHFLFSKIAQWCQVPQCLPLIDFTSPVFVCVDGQNCGESLGLSKSQ